MTKFFALLFTIGLAVPVLSYSSGGPKEACDDMIPQHHTDAQTSEIPYEFTFSRKKIRSGDEIKMTITGKGAKDTIKGFMIQARAGNKRVGHFVVDPNDPFVQILDCGDSNKATAVTHKKHDDKDDKRSFTVTWVSPKDLKSEIVFKSTIAKNGGEFWVAAESDKVKIY